MSDNKLHVDLRFAPAWTVLSQSIALARVANALESDDGKIIARSCILETAFVIEAVANSLLDSLSLANFDTFERLTSFAKLEMYARVTGKTIDFGRHEYGWAKELLCLRNYYVHPKVSTIRMDLIPVDEESQPKSYSGKAALTTYAALGISKDYGSCTAADANGVLRKLLAFLDRYLIDDCCMTAEEIRSSFLPRDQKWSSCFYPTDIVSHLDWCRDSLGYSSRLLQLFRQPDTAS